MSNYFDHNAVTEGLRRVRDAALFLRIIAPMQNEMIPATRLSARETWRARMTGAFASGKPCRMVMPSGREPRNERDAHRALVRS